MKRLFNVKVKWRKGALLGLGATLACCLSIAGAGLYNNAPASAMDTTTAENISGDLWNNTTGKFNQATVETLLEKTTGETQYGSALTYLNSNSGTISSADINALNGKDLVVTFGGKKWTVTYVSKNNAGELIATLYYADAESTAPFAGDASGTGWYSDNSSGDYSGYTNLGNHYGGSYIRAVALGNGGDFWSASGSSVQANSSTTRTKATAAQVQASAFYEYAQGALSTYLVAPKDVPWQQVEYNSAFNGNGYRTQNDNLTQQTTNWANTNIQNSQDDVLYYQWGADKVWLPGIYETGWDATNTGIWETTTEQRIGAGSYSWLRSGFLSNAGGAYLLNSAGNFNSGSYTSYSRGVRPALHLNMAKVAASYGDTSFDNAAMESAWNNAVQLSLDTNTQVTFQLPNSWYALPDTTYTTAFGDDSGVGFSNGRLYIPATANIKLDLNGKVLDRNLSAELAEGQVIYAEGKLEVCDYSVGQNGKITGGYGTNGGAVSVDNTTFTFTGGRISGNTAYAGGGIYASNSTVNITGGEISDNSATDGGGIYIDNGTITINGGNINNNSTTSNGAGIAFAGTAILNMNGGKITDNTAGGSGGGVGYVGSQTTDKGIMNFSGGEISYNTASAGAGVDFNQGGNGNEFNMTGGLVTHNIATVGNAGLRFYGGANASHIINITGGEISYNEAVNGVGGGIYAGAPAVGTIRPITFYFGGTAVVKNNSTSSDGGGLRLTSADFEISGGTITENTAVGFGGGISVTGDSNIKISGGEISNNTASNGGGVSASSNGTFIMNDGKISGNTATVNGGGVYLANTSTFTMDGGEISGNHALNTTSTAIGFGGGGVYVATGCTFEMNDGLIQGNDTASRGGGFYVNTNGTLTLNGGEISGNNAATYGGAMYAYRATFTMNGGLIKGNSALQGAGGVHVYEGYTLIAGGIITANTCSSTTVNNGNGGGLLVNQATSVDITGGQIYKNTSNGTENNVSIDITKTKLNVTGALAGSGKVTNIGISIFASPYTGAFTTGYSTDNSAYNPATFFFSDNVAYGVSLVSNEVTIKSPADSQTSLVWQYSTDGTNWTNIDAPYACVNYTGATYQIRALNGTNPVTLTTNAGNVSAAGKYAYSINNNSNAYVNPSLQFEILPVELVWQYSTDGGSTWKNITENTIDYTGLTYLIRAYDGANAATLSTDAGQAENAGTYKYVAANASGNYSNEEFTLTINRLHLTVEWKYNGALTDDRGNLYWDYDGMAHAPVAVLKGISNEQAGNLPLGYAFTVRGTNAGPDPLKIIGAGNYTVTVELLDASGNTLNNSNITLAEFTANFAINPLTVTLDWFDENGDAVTEAEYDYNGTGREVSATLSGLLPQDSVTPNISYVKAGGTLTGLPTDKGVYTAKAALPANCYNYVLDQVYTCQLEIKTVEISITWDGNAADGGKFEWDYYGDSTGRLPLPTLTNPVTGAHVSYTMEYAPVDAFGTVGNYVTAAPVDAGKYMARVKITDTAGNYTVTGETQAFEIKKLGVTVVWKDSANLSGIAPTVDGDGFIKWEYDGSSHDIVPVIDNVQVFKNGILGVSLTVTRADLYGALTGVATATATAQLDSTDAFNNNFVIIANATQSYKVYKKVISSATWTDKDGTAYVTGDTPRYDHGNITGANGPQFTVTAAGVSGTLTLQNPTYSATYSAEWPVDEAAGYKATAKLSAADYLNYEFADGTDETTITFYIRSVSGQKENITVTWVVFTGTNTYVTLATYGDFTYNGTAQYPRALYVKPDSTYEELALSGTGKGTDAGTYTVRLMPSSKYNIAAADFTCTYTIKPVDVTISWQKGATDGSQDFTSYIYNGNEQKPHAIVSGNGSLTCPVTVAGATNAGTYTATAVVSKNFNITSGATQVYTINKLQINASLIQWDYAADNALTNGTGGKYWIYDGNGHAPEAYIVLSQLSNLRIDFVVTGKSSAIGVHNVYAVLDSSDPAHANFDISGTATSEFEIVSVPVNTVYWEDGAGNTSVNGAALLSFKYNGTAQAPTAYRLDTDNVTHLPLTVAGAMTDAGTYVAYVTDNFNYGGIIPQCNFEITAVEVTIVWSDTTKTYNGLTQYPTATLEDGSGNAFVAVGGGSLTDGTDYEITGYSAAGTYTAEIRFLNKNYTYAGTTNSTQFKVESANLSSLVSATDWAADSTATTNPISGLYSWTYDAQNHAPTLSLATYRLDGDLVTITFGYTGVTETVGTHTVTAYIASAMWRGNDISANFDFTADLQYEIAPFEITLTWDFLGAGATQDVTNNVWYWIYNKSSHAPTASYTDWTGATQPLTVYGAETNARATAYTARVDAPANCVFTAGETGTQTFEIRQAAIVVEWRAPTATGTDASGNFYWDYDGNPHAPDAYVYGTNDALSVTGAATDAGDNYTATAAQGDSNYVITSNATCTFSIIPVKVYLKWYGKNNGTAATDFVWEYDGNNHAPTAVLVDASGNTVNDAAGNPIQVSVTGAMANVGTGLIAHAVDTFPNYDFHTGAVTTQSFDIEAKSLSGFGFAWQAPGATKSNDGTYDVYTYEYTGGVIAPTPYTQNSLSFDMTINVYTAAGGTGAQVQAITEIGEYVITIRPVNGNYAVPSGMETVRVTVNPRSVEVVWSTAQLVYNGSAQTPAAEYVDVDGNTVTLAVSGAMTDAGKGYTATASFIGTAPANYVLDTGTVSKSFDIAQREIPVQWTWSSEWVNKRVTYDTLNHNPVPQINTSVVLSADKTNLTFAYEITKTGMTPVVNGTVSGAGEYTVTLKLNGVAAANYAFESGKEQEKFTILKVTLTVTADDFTVNYGDNPPAYTATFTGFVPAEETALKASLAAVQSSWLRCSYINRSTPGSYAIGLVYTELSNLLPNYDVVTNDGTLTVNPATGTVIWTGDLPDLGAYYDGAEYKPFAFYYDINDPAGNNPITLNVVYATYSGGVYTEAANPAAAINAGTYYVIAKSANANLTLANSEITYEIYKREITVEIESKASVYGSPYKTLTHKHANGSLLPLPGDDLQITLNCDVLDTTLYVNGFMNAGTYDISGSWDSATFGANYNVVFTGEKTDASGNNTLGIYEITKADIRVTKANEAYSNEEFTSIHELDTQGLGIQIKLGDTYADENGINQYRYIQYAGYQNATGVTVHYSRVHNIGTIETGLLTPPDPHDMTAGVNNYQLYRDRIRNIGCYAINYYIEIPNHETLYGTWTVLMLPENQVVRISFEKDFEIEYGKPIPEDLAEELLNGGYITVNIAPERFLKYASAKVMDGRGGYVGNTTSAGKYTIEVEIANTDSNTQLLVTYHNDFGDEDTNIGRYVITRKKLTIDWGNLEFDHDGTLKMPAPNVYGWVTADTLVLEDIQTRAGGTEYEYTSFTVIDNGVAVTVIVAARGNFTDVGGHMLVVAVENGNYVFEALNSNATVSIKGDTIIEEEGLPDWLLYVIIAAAVLVAILIIIIIIVARKKRAIIASMEDDDGFYDDYNAQ